MTALIVESVGLALTAESRVDPDQGIIYGAKVLGKESRNKRRYPADVIARRFKVYEGAQCYANHDFDQPKTGRPRALQDWGGVIRDVVQRGGEVFGNVQCLKETPAGRIILEAALRCPDRFGLSPMHLIESRKEADGWETVTDILECWSVDAVTRPATTRTLFEGEEMTMPDPAIPNGNGNGGNGTIDQAFAALAAAIMAEPSLDDKAKGAAVNALLKLKTKILSPPAETPAEAPAAAPAAAEAERKAAPEPPAVAEADGIAARLAALEQSGRRAAIRQLAGEGMAIDDPLMADLLAQPDDAAVGRYLDRIRAGRPSRPSAGAVRSGAQRTAAGAPVGEATDQRGKAKEPPRLTAGASREDVKRFWTSED